MTSENVRPIKDAEFEQLVANTPKVVLIDFMAPWCAPCRQMAPIIDEIATEFSEELMVRCMDVDQDPETAKRLGIRGLPTFLILKDGVEVAREIGMLTKTKLAALLESHFA